jgi:hypothetical protein
MSHRTRFEKMIRELEAVPGIQIQEAKLGPPTERAEMERWRELAGAAWPDGMSELYSELSSVDIDYMIEGDCGGGIHLPPLHSIWDYQALEGELWFDFCGAQHPFHFIRPIDRFVPEAYAVLHPVPGDATVHYHYCGESLVPTGLSYREWLELLYRARGAFYWLQLTVGPWRGERTWVEQGLMRVASIFPDFQPLKMCPSRAFEEIPLD